MAVRVASKDSPAPAPQQRRERSAACRALSTDSHCALAAAAALPSPARAAGLLCHCSPHVAHGFMGMHPWYEQALSSTHAWCD